MPSLLRGSRYQTRRAAQAAAPLSCQGKSFCKLVQDGVDCSFDVAEFEDGAADAFIDIMERFAGL